MQVGPKHVSGAAFAASAQHVGAYAATRMGGQRQAEATQAAAVLWQLTSAKRTWHTHQSSQGPAYACRTWQAASLGLHCHVVPCSFRSTRRLLRPCALCCNSRSTLSRQAAVPVRIHCGCTRRRRTETASAPAPRTGQKQAVLYAVWQPPQRKPLVRPRAPRTLARFVAGRGDSQTTESRGLTFSRLYARKVAINPRVLDKNSRDNQRPAEERTMLEGVVASVLERVAGTYVDGMCECRHEAAHIRRALLCARARATACRFIALLAAAAASAALCAK